MDIISAPTKVSRAPDILTAELDGELLLMNIDQGRYYALKGTARHVWSLLERVNTFDDLCSTIRQHYRSPPGKIDADVKAFVAKLADQNLLVLS